MVRMLVWQKEEEVHNPPGDKFRANLALRRRGAEKVRLARMGLEPEKEEVR